MGASTSASTVRKEHDTPMPGTPIMTVHTTANIANIQKEQVVTGTNCAPDSAKYVRKSKIPVALVLVKRCGKTKLVCDGECDNEEEEQKEVESTIMLEEEEKGG